MGIKHLLARFQQMRHKVPPGCSTKMLTHSKEGGRANARQKMADLTHVSDETFDQEVLDSDKPVLVDFWADWCNPCKMIEPHLVALAEEHSDKLRVVKVNLDENPRTAGRYGVMSIPTVMLVVDGVERARLVGARPKAAIWSEIESYVLPVDLGSETASSAGA